MRKYVWKKADGFSNPLRIARLMEVAGNRVEQGTGPFDLTQDGDPIASNKSRAEVLDALKQALTHREIGSTFRVRNAKAVVVFVARAVTVAPDYSGDSTNGNSHADAYYNWVRTVFKDYDPRYAGAYVCKQISGSSTLSQHSYGNAVDFFFNTLDNQDKVFDAIKRGECPVPVAHAISRARIWEPGTGEHAYGGDYHSHLHVDFLPQFSGGCGVREP
jgi:hypothetical protein